MNLAGADLNLLVALRALLQERNVTRAAQVVGLSQPAMSNALARLRRQFGDELLVREGRGLALTPVARELQHAVEPALGMVERALRIQASFDPATAVQHFRIAASDYGMTLLAERLRELRRVAPGITVDLVQIDHGFVRESETVMRGVDLLLAPRAFLSGHPNAALSSEPWVAVVDADQPAGDLTEEGLVGRSLVGLFHDLGSGAHIERLLTVRGITATGAVNVESFSAVPALVEGTDRVGFLPAGLARRLALGYDVRVVELPFLGEPLVECLYWHRSAQRDPAHQWLRRLILGAESGPEEPESSAP
ncbi:LysR family transcriptional regulator [Modestobacter altitudinis]|uniref:LysR family transcriptional regulator n=1 Tax=Modestobacter altitudinis TaxID=2213158 RepID=UPI0015D22524|nr:LysR family transcriptional regulator [Modestobacter altitudinis]